MNSNSKKLLLALSCGHTLVLDRHEAGARANGNTYDCPKCPWNAPPRRVKERSWVTDKALVGEGR